MPNPVCIQLLLPPYQQKYSNIAPPFPLYTTTVTSLPAEIFKYSSCFSLYTTTVTTFLGRNIQIYPLLTVKNYVTTGPVEIFYYCPSSYKQILLLTVLNTVYFLYTFFVNFSSGFNLFLYFRAGFSSLLFL